MYDLCRFMFIKQLPSCIYFCSIIVDFCPNNLLLFMYDLRRFMFVYEKTTDFTTKSEIRCPEKL